MDEISTIESAKREESDTLPRMSVSVKSETNLHVDAPIAQSRVAVFFRVILILPQWIVCVFLLNAIMLLTVPGWFIAVFTGRNPFHRLTSVMLAWYYRVTAYGFLLTDRYPPFRLVTPLYPIDIDFEEEPLGRLSVLLRLILVIPAYLVLSVVGCGMSLFAVAAWLITVVRGTMPNALHGALSAQLRFSLRVTSYLYILQDAYPRGLFGDPDVAPGNGDADASEATAAIAAEPEATDVELPAPSDEVDGSQVAVTPWSQDWTLRLTRGARRIVVISLVLGVVLFPASIVIGYEIGHHAARGAEQNWSTLYGPRVATLNGDAKRAVDALSATPPSWPAISAACHAVNSDLQSLASVPQYPRHGPDQLLLNGFATIYRGELSCASAAAAQQASGLASAAAQMQAGVLSLVGFLSAIPTP